MNQHEPGGYVKPSIYSPRFPIFRRGPTGTTTVATPGQCELGLPQHAYFLRFHAVVLWGIAGSWRKNDGNTPDTYCDKHVLYIHYETTWVTKNTSFVCNTYASTFHPTTTILLWVCKGQDEGLTFWRIAYFVRQPHVWIKEGSLYICIRNYLVLIIL